MHGATGTWLRVVRLVQAAAQPGCLSRRLQAYRPVLGVWWVGLTLARLLLGMLRLRQKCAKCAHLALKVVRLLLDAVILFSCPAIMLIHVTIMLLKVVIMLLQVVLVFMQGVIMLLQVVVVGVIATMITLRTLREAPVTMRQAMSIARPNNVPISLGRGVLDGLGTPGIPGETADSVAWILAHFHFDGVGIYRYE